MRSRNGFVAIAFGLLVLTLIFFPRGLVPERVDENV